MKLEPFTIPRMKLLGSFEDFTCSSKYFFIFISLRIQFFSTSLSPYLYRSHFGNELKKHWCNKDPPKSRLSQVGLPMHAFRQVISVFIIYFSVSDPQKEEQARRLGEPEARSLREEDARQKSRREEEGHCEEGCQKSCCEKEGRKDIEGLLHHQEKPCGKEVRPRELTAKKRVRFFSLILIQTDLSRTLDTAGPQLRQNDSGHSDN